MMRIAGGDPEGKIHMLLDYSDSPRAIADPWYTGNFDITYDDVVEGCTAFFNYLEESGSIFLIEIVRNQSCAESEDCCIMVQAAEVCQRI